MFSVLIPAFKEKYLRKAIDSVIRQTYTDIEIIIVNDRSPEDIAGTVSSYTDPRIRYYENDVNLGSKNVVQAWNKCLEYATRDFCILFSDDDILEPDFLHEVHRLILRYPDCDLFSCRTAVIDQDDKVIRFSASAPEFETLHEFMWHRLYNFRDIFAQNYVFRRSALKEINGFVEFPLAWATDDATWYSLARRNGVASTSRVLCNWRFSELNISNIGNSLLRFEAINRYYGWLSDLAGQMPVNTAFEQNMVKQIRKQIPVKRKEAFEYIIERNLSNKGFLNTIQLYVKIRSVYGIKMKTVMKLIVQHIISG